MKLTDSGESRVRGYLYVFERSLRTFLSREVAADAVREVESHIRDAVAQAPDTPDERGEIERILARLGAPMKVAQAYSLELVMEEAAATGRVVAVARSLFHAATSGVGAFLGAVGLFVGYTVGLAFLLMALLKPIFPNNVGVWVRNGVPVSIGGQFPVHPIPGVEMTGGYAVMFLAAIIGLGTLVVTHKLARRWASWLRTHVNPLRTGSGTGR